MLFLSDHQMYEIVKNLRYEQFSSYSILTTKFKYYYVPEKALKFLYESSKSLLESITQYTVIIQLQHICETIKLSEWK